MFRILVCDDDREIVHAIELYLTEEGYEVLCAYDGLEAAEAVRRETVHLLIVDIMMPKMDGIQAITQIRRFSTIPIICLTAKTEDEDKIAGLNAGADDYMEKPFNPLELIARVKSRSDATQNWEICPRVWLSTLTFREGCLWTMIRKR